MGIVFTGIGSTAGLPVEPKTGAAPDCRAAICQLEPGPLHTHVAFGAASLLKYCAAGGDGSDDSRPGPPATGASERTGSWPGGRYDHCPGYLGQYGVTRF